MSIYKRGDVYWYKFQWNGKLIRESTKQGNDKSARRMEAARKTELAAEHKERESRARELGCLPGDLIYCLGCERLFNEATAVISERGKFCGKACLTKWEKDHHTVPSLGEFLKRDFVPFIKTKHAAKPATVEYYVAGANMLTNSDLGKASIDEVTDQHAQQFGAQRSHLSASYINRGLRTLRRALNLAFEWGKLERPVRIHLAAGERQRDRVLSPDEVERYLGACPQPWRDCATLIVDEGMRPGEVFALRWSHVLLNGSGGLIRVAEGKSKAARRILPMTARVFETLRTRQDVQGHPSDGWVFPSTARDGHLNRNVTKDQHAKALAALEKAHKENPAKVKKVPPFEPYCLRHTALTRLADAGCDAFTLAKIAGHSSIAITMRYCHPQAEAVERAFNKLAQAPKGLPPGSSPAQVGTKLGTIENVKVASDLG